MPKRRCVLAIPAVTEKEIIQKRIQAFVKRMPDVLYLDRANKTVVTIACVLACEVKRLTLS